MGRPVQPIRHGHDFISTVKFSRTRSLKIQSFGLGGMLMYDEAMATY